MWWVFQTILFQPYFTWNSTYTAMVLQQVEELVHWLPLWQGVEVTTAMITSAIAIAIVLNTATKYCLAKAKLYKKSWKLLMGFLWSLVICKDLFEKTWSDKKKESIGIVWAVWEWVQSNMHTDTWLTYISIGPSHPSRAGLYEGLNLAVP